MGEPSGAKLRLDSGHHRRGIAHYQRREKAGRLRIKDLGSESQPGPQPLGDSLDRGRSRQYVRLTSHPQYGHRQVGSVGSGKQAGGPYSLAGQQAEPAVRRCQQNHPTAGAPLLPSHHRGL